VQHFNPNAGQNFGATKLCPSLEKAQQHHNCIFINALQHKQTLARDVIKGLRLAKNKAKMKNQVQEINEPEFEMKVLRCAQPVLVGFLADWSKPSRLVEPVLDEVAEACNGSATIFKVNVDDNPDLGTIYSIQSVPTLIYFFNDTVRAIIVGMVSPKAILAKLNSPTPGNTSTKDIEPSRG
jgi:thioredoxin 1